MVPLAVSPAEAPLVCLLQMISEVGAALFQPVKDRPDLHNLSQQSLRPFSTFMIFLGLSVTKVGALRSHKSQSPIFPLFIIIILLF